VIGAWTSHPEWPELTVVTQLQQRLSRSNGNVKRLTSRVSDGQLHRLQNMCAVHVCPSEVEGFGHTLMEAMSCGAVLITTDAPPMDELVLPDEGMLVPPARTVPMGAGTRYMVDERRLAETITRVWRMDATLFDRFRRAARAKFEASQAFFYQGFARAIQGI
jgi:glycosyltransferase involved in cell wall biosynthesis